MHSPAARAQETAGEPSITIETRERHPVSPTSKRDNQISPLGMPRTMSFSNREKKRDTVEMRRTLSSGHIITRPRDQRPQTELSDCNAIELEDNDPNCNPDVMPAGGTSRQEPEAEPADDDRTSDGNLSAAGCGRTVGSTDHPGSPKPLKRGKTLSSLSTAMPFPNRSTSVKGRRGRGTLPSTNTLQSPDREFVTTTNWIREQLEARAKQLPKDGFVLHPDRSRFLAMWDVVTACALCYTALLTPFEVAFLPAPKTVTDPWFLVNRLLDAIFLVDLVLQVPPACTTRASALHLRALKLCMSQQSCTARVHTCTTTPTWLAPRVMSCAAPMHMHMRADLHAKNELYAH